jgi:hypothetical protein
MTALTRALEWFVAPPRDPAPPRRAAPPRPGRRGPAPARDAFSGLRPGEPVHEVLTAGGVSEPLPAPGSRAGDPPMSITAAAHALARQTRSETALSQPGVALRAEAVSSAAVLGVPQDVGPVAAGVALALRRETRAKVATVAVIGELPLELGNGGSGGPAARRISARLDALGLEPVIRGRLVWTRIDPRDPQLPSLVRQVALIAAPAVFAVTAPRTPAVDEALSEQDLLVLATTDPDGPLARIASVGLPPMSVFPVAPLTRGPARALARCGLRAPMPMRSLIAPTGKRRR